jgi:hypothetical protein
MFPNLRAEMARNKITLDQVAAELHLNVSTVSAKLSNYNRLKYCECATIRDKFFPKLTIDYLFSSECEPKSA